jgi:hypothetical protein
MMGGVFVFMLDLTGGVGWGRRRGTTGLASQGCDSVFGLSGGKMYLGTRVECVMDVDLLWLLVVATLTYLQMVVVWCEQQRLTWLFDHPCC